MTKEEKVYYRTHFKCFYKRSDLFALFVESGLTRFSNINSTIAFIVPSVIHSNLSYKPLRSLILDNHWLHEVCYTGGKVFDTPTIDTTILICQKPESSQIRLKNAIDFAHPTISEVSADHFTAYQNIISVENGNKASIFAKMLANSTFHYVTEDFSVFQGIVTGNNTAFIFETAANADIHGIEKELLHPLCHGRDIERFAVRSRERRILYLTSDNDIRKTTNAEMWLKPFKAELSKRREVVRGIIPWYSLQWPRVKSELDTKEKILVQNTRNESLPIRIVAALDNQGVYATQGVNFIIPSSGKVTMRFLLGILNSKLINFLFQTKFLNLAIKAEYLKQICLPPEDPAIVSIVEHILKAKEADLNTDTSVLEAEINKMVYALYGLTKDEITLVEESTATADTE